MTTEIKDEFGVVYKETGRTTDEFGNEKIDYQIIVPEDLVLRFVQIQ